MGMSVFSFVILFSKEYAHKKQIFMQKLLKKSLVEKAEESIDQEIEAAIECIKNYNEVRF